MKIHVIVKSQDCLGLDMVSISSVFDQYSTDYCSCRPASPQYSDDYPPV